jgi:hypothetical protein
MFIIRRDLRHLQLAAERNFPSPPSTLRANSKLGQAPGTSFEPYPIPRPGRPKNDHPCPRHSPIAKLKSYPSADAVNTTPGPQLPKYVFHAFGSLDTP